MTNNEIFRKRKQRQFTVLDNGMLQDERLSWKARGLLCYLFSLPDDWKIYKGELQLHSQKDGRESTDTAWKELIANGYVRSVQLRNAAGQIQYSYEVSEEPLPVEPSTGFPSTAFPSTVNPQLQNTQEQRTQEQRTQQQTDAVVTAVDVGQTDPNPKANAVALPVEDTPTAVDAPRSATPPRFADEYTDEQEVSVSYSVAATKLSNLQSQLLSARQWIETTCMQLKIQPDHLKTLVVGFIENELSEISAGSLLRADRSLRSHLKNWLRKQVELGRDSHFHPDHKTTLRAGAVQTGPKRSERSEADRLSSMEKARERLKRIQEKEKFAE